MRLINLIYGDIRFQYKYGFYFVYVVFTLMYISVLFFLPLEWREKTAAVLIFSDPSAMGLFFMGAIVLLEKSERVLSTIAVSPVKADDYIISKVVSLGVISVISGASIALSADVQNILIVLMGVFAGSVLFTLVGLIIAININSLNQFVTAVVPVEIIIFIPPLLYVFGYDNKLMLLHPGCMVISMISGSGNYILFIFPVLIMWFLVLYKVARFNVIKMFQSLGGIKL
ncbi:MULTISPECIES: fluoroquinolone export ABC transporter permease subunit [unclassified Sedimentibacter]|uniref:fluoroquinolone export ABC transporter permease subunit n=1 Tax=unclassified Sedimentibacter TaxID=2649220 RepID=UPI0027E002C6|nr:ABC transporter permease [Sedimentibacter sp. MB35-C1]WMJ78965.1 ABC transporter permease [Sedimentibacter sp. MB35-C1]